MVTVTAAARDPETTMTLPPCRFSTTKGLAVTRLFTLLAAPLAALALAAQPLRADLITYTWDDRGSASGFGGSFSLDSTLLTPAPGGLARFDASAMTASDFFYKPVGGSSVAFPVSGMTAGDYLIDPLTGTIHSGSRLTFGPSTGSGWGVTGGGVSFYSEITGPYAGTQYAYLADNVPPDGEFLASIGRWNATITPTAIPAPPAMLLVAVGAGLLGLRRLSSRRRESGGI